ncbi:MAG TPA: helix-turn-helix transcriptional regulator [Woeseiaceae bacterium]|nr:helix-turn-helix transcriptional regulator [Woeseiaceae bacterium]
MRITAELTDDTVLQLLGTRIKQHRLEAGMTQAELAGEAGVGKRTLERIEAGEVSGLLTLVRLLRVLKLIEGLDRLVPEIKPGPITQLKTKGKRRKRVAHPRSKTRSARKSAEPWTWGEE